MAENVWAAIIWGQQPPRVPRKWYMTAKGRLLPHLPQIWWIGMQLLTDAGWFHWSGIPSNLVGIYGRACRYAIGKTKKAGLTVCCDINYRKNLWNYGKTFEEVMRPLSGQSDVVFGSEDGMGAYSGSWNRFLQRNCGEGRRLCHRPLKTARWWSLLIQGLSEISIFTVEMHRVVNANHHLLSAVIYDGKNRCAVCMILMMLWIVECRRCLYFSLGQRLDYLSRWFAFRLWSFGLAASTLKNTMYRRL